MLDQNHSFVARKKTSDWFSMLLDGLQHILILISFLMFLSFVQTATAADLDNNNLLLYADAGITTQTHAAVAESTMSASLLKTDIDMRISGMINRVHIVQIFNNPSANKLSGTYLFPLPQEAIVDQMRIQMGDRIIESNLVSVEQGQQQYTRALDGGARISLLQQHRPNIFSTSIAGIEPYQQIRIEISFQHMVRYEQGEFRLRMPMYITPRYIPGVPASEKDRRFEKYMLATDSNQDAVSTYTVNSLSSLQGSSRAPVSMHIELDAGFPLVSLDSRYHAVTKTNHGPGRFSIRFKDGVELARRDFELYWQPEPDQLPRSAVFHEEYAGEHYYFVVLYPQQQTLYDQLPAQKEVIYVLDTSGSMAGAPIRQARSALLTALKQLDAQDTFNVITFNTTTQSLFEQSRPASVLNIARARQFVAQINASGGSEMLPALQKALQTTESAQKLRQIVYLTDGAVINEQALFDRIRNDIGSNRLFTVGIGAAPNAYFLAKAAEAGNGSYTYIGDVAEIESRLGQLFNKINHPVIHHLSVIYQPETALTQRFDIADLYSGEPVMFALKTNGGHNEVNIVGYRADQQWNSRLSLAENSPGDGIAKFWAMQLIEAKLKSISTSDDAQGIKSAVQQIALQYGITSPYTSLVATERSLDQDHMARVDSLNSNSTTTAVTMKDTAKPMVVALNAKTATDAQLRIFAGMLSLLLAMLVRYYLNKRRRVRAVIL